MEYIIVIQQLIITRDRISGIDSLNAITMRNK